MIVMIQKKKKGPEQQSGENNCKIRQRVQKSNENFERKKCRVAQLREQANPIHQGPDGKKVITSIKCNIFTRLNPQMLWWT